MSELPRIISTDDHVVEPPDLWTSRLPAKYQDKAPHVERDRAKFGMAGGVFSFNKGAPDGDWCAGEGHGRLLPLTSVPLWDPALAAAEVQRCAAKGSFAITFPENPYPLGLPSIHDKDRHWDPLFAAVEETQTTLCMHIGS